MDWVYEGKWTGSMRVSGLGLGKWTGSTRVSGLGL